mmetsp:Transcript_18849/g.63186  ORF Transcript_18849/g.63186 Transcript_18849/m.63186 type:complete len:217 (-) Transcript_18849:117-767(-)
MAWPFPRQLVAAARDVTALPGEPKARRLARSTTAGASLGTRTRASVTMRVRVCRWRKAASTAAYPKPRRSEGRRREKGISSAHSGASGASRAVSSRAPKRPRRGRGRSSGKEYWSGTVQTWAAGKRREKGAAKALCSYCVLPMTMCRTGPPRPRSMRTSSRVGASGLSTHREPSLSRTTVIRELALIVDPSPTPRDCSCSKAHTRRGLSSVTCVRR